MDEEKEKPQLPKKDPNNPIKSAQKGGTRGGKTSGNESEEIDK